MMVRMWLSNREEISYPSDNRIGRKCEAYLTKASFADGSEDLKMIEVDCGRYLKIIAWHTLWANPNSYYLLMVNWVFSELFLDTGWRRRPIFFFFVLLLLYSFRALCRALVISIPIEFPRITRGLEEKDLHNSICEYSKASSSSRSSVLNLLHPPPSSTLFIISSFYSFNRLN